MLSASDEDMPPEATQVTYKHVYDGPITRNRAKILQKEVNSLLSETNFNIFENIILPKCSMLILLRHVHKEDWNTKQSGNQFTSTQATSSRQPVRTSPNQFGPPDRTNPVRTNQIGLASSDHQFGPPKEMALSPNSRNL